jgi:Zn-dependent M16 (insulinase) family peptidase
MLAAASMSFINQVIHKQSKDYNMQLLKKVRAVSVEDLKNVLKELVLPVFQHETSNTVVVTAPVKADVSFSFSDLCITRGQRKLTCTLDIVNQRVF